mmetsp:Transcript_22737/g.63239  ORF Transcript_22737/g.63239 Transcript_22737/m.63239 type:complete len:226 (+) Transcript_22737:398-1075(+)
MRLRNRWKRPCPSKWGPHHLVTRGLWSGRLLLFSELSLMLPRRTTKPTRRHRHHSFQRYSVPTKPCQRKGPKKPVRRPRHQQLLCSHPTQAPSFIALTTKKLCPHRLEESVTMPFCNWNYNCNGISTKQSFQWCQPPMTDKINHVCARRQWMARVGSRKIQKRMILHRVRLMMSHHGTLLLALPTLKRERAPPAQILKTISLVRRSMPQPLITPSTTIRRCIASL